jgi:hypothetical protein
MSSVPARLFDMLAGERRQVSDALDEAQRAAAAALEAQARATAAEVKGKRAYDAAVEVQAKVEAERDRLLAELDAARAAVILDGGTLDRSVERSLAAHVDLYVSAAVVAAQRTEAADYIRWTSLQARSGADQAARQAQEILEARQRASDDQPVFAGSTPWGREMQIEPIAGEDVPA